MPSLRFACRSDPLSPEAHARWTDVEAWAASQGWPTRAAREGDLWNDEDWWLVADPTGGTKAIESLSELMDAVPEGPSPRGHHRAWWAMSDNCLVLNALLDRGLCRALHGHPLTLASREASAQRARFLRWGEALRRGDPFPSDLIPPLVPLCGRFPSTLTLVGGNLGALERLGQTPWRPRPNGRVLLIESLSAPADQAAARVEALIEDPWWEGIGGLILGRFTAADRDAPGWIDGCLSLLPPNLPVARWPLVGHGSDGWTVPLGEPLTFL